VYSRYSLNCKAIGLARNIGRKPTFATQIDAEDVHESNILPASDSAEATMEAENTEDVIAPEPLRDDFGPFDVATISNVLQNRNDVAIMTTTLDNVNRVDMRTVIRINDGNAANDRPLEVIETAVEEQIHQWHLVFVFLSEITDDSWTGTMYSRHRDSFDGWWKYSRGDKSWRHHCGEIENRWDIAVYVNGGNEKFDDLRDTFLSNIGGQRHLFCKDHNVPLIASFEKDVTCSCEASCTKIAKLQCPCNQCKVGVCYAHLTTLNKEAQTNGRKMYVKVDDADVSVVDDVINHDSHSDEIESVVGSIQDDDDDSRGSDDHDNVSCDPVVDYGDEDSDSDVSIHSKESEANSKESQANTCGISSGNIAERDGIEQNIEPSYMTQAIDYVDDASSQGLADHEMAYLTEDLDLDKQDCITDPMLTYDESDSDDSIRDATRRIAHVEISDSVDGQFNIPTSNSGVAAMDVSMKDQSFILLYAVLNNCGTLLVRKQSKLKASRRQQHFLHKIAAVSPGQSIPLLYPEGMLFPSLFWKGSGDGGVLGAIPCACMTQGAILKRQGIADIPIQMKTRITNMSLMHSTDSRYITYAFDCVTNLNLRGEDSRFLLSRGLGSHGPKECGVGRKEQLFDSDSIDSRPVVNRLCAAIAKETPQYFYTHTANQREHFGLAKLKQWLDSDEIVDQFCIGSKATMMTQDDIRQSILSGSAVFMLRQWMEISMIYMQYIAHSDERPLGKVKKIWWRHEYQDTMGNLSHIHSLIWLDDGELEAVTLDRIRGSTTDLIRAQELDGLIQEGLIADEREAIHVTNEATRILKHTCTARCKKLMSNGQLTCRVDDNARMNPIPTRHSTVEVYIKHSEQAESLLEQMDLFQPNPLIGMSTPLHPKLVTQKHFPDACRGEGIISPCNGRLFVAHRSSDNLK
jgi:hypothetical protein